MREKTIDDKSDCPGLCVTAEPALTRVALQCAKSIQSAMAKQPGGAFLHFRFEVGPDWRKEAWVVLSHMRGSRPRLTILAQCSLDADSRCLSIDGPEVGFEFTLSTSFVGDALREAPGNLLDQVCIYVAPAPVEEQGSGMWEN